MPLFYDRQDHPTGTTIVLKTWPRLVAMLCIFAGYLLREPLGEAGMGPLIYGLLTAGGFVLFMVYYFSTRGIRKDLRAAMEKGSIRVSGSTWNPSKPLTYSFGEKDQAEGSVGISDSPAP